MPDEFYKYTLEEFAEIAHLICVVYEPQLAAAVIGKSFDEIRPIYH